MSTASLARSSLSMVCIAWPLYLTELSEPLQLLSVKNLIFIVWRLLGIDARLSKKNLKCKCNELVRHAAQTVMVILQLQLTNVVFFPKSCSYTSKDTFAVGLYRLDLEDFTEVQGKAFNTEHM